MAKKPLSDPGLAAPPAAGPEVDRELVRPRPAAPDSFEQNPLSQVAERLSLQAAEGIDDAGRVREALRIVVDEEVSIAEAARRCNVSPSFLAAWREKYVTLLSDEPSIAAQPLLQRGATMKDADLVCIPSAAREHFADNWERLVEITRATPSTFRQHPVQLFLENSKLTNWLYNEGRLDRGVFAGVTVVFGVLLLTISFLMAGHFYRQDTPRQPKPLNMDIENRRAAEVANRFFKAATMEEKMKFVRHNEQSRALMEDYYRKHPAASIPDAMLTRAMANKGLYALEFEIPSLHRRHVCIVADRGGEMLVDWETSSLFQEEHLQEIRKQKPVNPVRVAVRVFEDTYYNYGFTQKAFSCYRLAYPGLQLDLFAYAVKDSQEDQTLKALLKPVTENERQITAVLEVKFPAGENVPSNQVEIVRILNEEWLAP
jgi:hypothetical protein